MNREETVRILSAQRDALRERGITRLALFGSLVRDQDRTESDIGRASMLMISIGIMTGIMILGTPGGTRILRNLNPCFAKPTNRVKTKIQPAKVPVTTSWLVMV